MISLRYLVTGTGRNGTVNLAMTLTSVGVPCAHERFFNGNSLEEALTLLQCEAGRNSYCSREAGLDSDGKRVVVCSSYMAAPFLDHPVFADTTIIHAVRHPVKVILSFLNDIQFFQQAHSDRPHESFIYAHLGELRHIPDPVDRAAYYYIAWNRLIEEKTRGRATILHRIEDGPAGLLRKLGLGDDVAAGAYRNPTCNTWPRKTYQYAPEDVYASRFRLDLADAAARYGYNGLARSLAAFAGNASSHRDSDLAAAQRSVV